MHINHLLLATAIQTLPNLKQKTKDTIVKRLIANNPNPSYDLNMIYTIAKKQNMSYACVQLRAMFFWLHSNEGSRFWFNVHYLLNEEYKTALEARVAHNTANHASKY